MFLDVVSEATGLEVETIREQSASGATLAEIITANGGNVEAVKATMIEAMRNMPLPQGGDVEQLVDTMLNSSLSQPNFAGQGFPGGGRQGGGPPGRGPMMLLNIVSEATGLEVETLREQSANGATLAEIITANGGDVEAVKLQMIEAMGDMPMPRGGNVEQFVDNMLRNEN